MIYPNLAECVSVEMIAYLNVAFMTKLWLVQDGPELIKCYLSYMILNKESTHFEMTLLGFRRLFEHRMI